MPAGPTRPSECIAMPSVGALTTVRLGWGFSVTGVDGVRATDPPRARRTWAERASVWAATRGGWREGAEEDDTECVAPRPEAIRAASSRISRCARSISSTARCCSSSASSGDLVVMPRKATAARDGSASHAFVGCRGAPTLAVVVAPPCAR